MTTAVFTICAKNYVPLARTLFASVRRSHPDFDCHLVLSDENDGLLPPGSEPFSIIEPRDLSISGLADMQLRYDITEFSTAIKPAAFEFLFRSGRYESILYLDPDTYVVSPMVELVDLLKNGASAVVTPHLCQPVEDHRKPDDQSILQAGLYNLGFVAFRPTPDVLDFLQWWQRRLAEDCRVDLAEGLFVDQKWAELLPCYVDNTAILRHPGYNVAYWNLMHRAIDKPRGEWHAAGKALRFFHWSGVDFENDKIFSKHQDRFSRSNIGRLSELLDTYRKEVTANGRKEFAHLPYAYSTLPDGTRISQVVRRLYREDLATTTSLARDPSASLVAHCNQPSPRIEQDPGRQITNLMMKIWDGRPDLQNAFDLASEKARQEFVNWFLHSATRELELDEVFVSTVLVDSEPTGVGPRAADPRPALGSLSVPGFRGVRSELASWALVHAHRLKSLYMRIPVEVRQRVKHWLLRTAYSQAPRVDPPAGTTESREPGRARVGARLVGYARAEIGMGEHVRLSALALESINVPFSIYDFSLNVNASQNDDRVEKWLDRNSNHPVNIFHINADQMPVAHEALGASFFSDHYNIGYWAWELSRFPDAWGSSVEMVDEIWAPSRFIRDSIAASTEKPVQWMPLAVAVDPPATIDRSYFHLPKDRFLFLFSFDFASFVSRKNPAAVIEAFRLAFPRGEEPVWLVIKTLAHDRYPAEMDELQRAAALDPRIEFVVSVLSYAENAGLTNCCDCYVSLHRSEGFGRGMAEAMHLGKPVIATSYSGNMDFMDRQAACLVDFNPVPVAEGEYPHFEGQVWADPDLDQAAAYMRQLWQEPAYARKIGSHARQLLVGRFSPQQTGVRIRQRLRELGAV